MLKFFQKIRQQLIDDNERSEVLPQQNQGSTLTERTAKRMGRLTKYLFYTIGEIILVVIGILIALQINGRNSFKRNRTIEREYLQRLVGDLKTDTSYHIFVINRAEKKIIIKTSLYLAL